MDEIIHQLRHSMSIETSKVCFGQYIVQRLSAALIFCSQEDVAICSIFFGSVFDPIRFSAYEWFETVFRISKAYRQSSIWLTGF